MNDTVFTLPTWVVHAWGFWFLFMGIHHALEIYWSYLNKKVEDMKRMRSTATCTADPDCPDCREYKRKIDVLYSEWLNLCTKTKS